VVNLATGTAANGYGGTDLLRNVNDVFVNGLNNTLIGTSGQTLEVAGGDRNVVTVSGSGDILRSDDGFKTLLSNGTGNALQDASGTAVAIYSGGSFVADLGSGHVQAAGSGLSDTLVGITNIVLLGDNEVLTSGAGNETLAASGVHDTLFMTSGTDTFFGGSG